MTSPPPSRSRRAEFAAALLALVLGAGGALLASLPAWQVLRTTLPQRVDVLNVSGRTVDSAPTALALVALAGIVAVLATRGRWRQVVGAAVTLAGVGLVVRALGAAGALGADRARSIVQAQHETVRLAGGARPQVEVHGVWAVLTVVCGVLVLLSGGAIAARGARWQGMSARYETSAGRDDSSGPGVAVEAALDPDDARAAQAKAAAAMWTALDRGEDPTRG